MASDRHIEETLNLETQIKLLETPFDEVCRVLGIEAAEPKNVIEVDDLSPTGALSLLLLAQGPLFIGETQVHAEPDGATLAQTVISAARHVRRFGIAPKIAICSGSQFGNLESRSGLVTREAVRLLDLDRLDFEYEGEMQTDLALDPELRERLFPSSRLTGKANVLIYANTDAAGAWQLPNSHRGWMAANAGTPPFKNELAAAAAGALLGPKSWDDKWVVAKVDVLKEQGVYSFEQV